MRLAESSDAVAEGFGAAKKEKPSIGRWTRQSLSHISPVSIAVAVTAFLAASLFSAYDAAVTLDSARNRLQLIARSVSAELGPMSTEEAGAALRRVVETYDPNIRASLRGPDGRIVYASDMWTDVDEGGPVTALNQIGFEAGAGPKGTLSLQLDTMPMLLAALQRAGIAFALALAVAGIAFRWRRFSAQSEAVQRKRYEDLIATIPFGVACWTAAGELVVCNQQYRSRLNADPRSVRPGASYHHAVKTLVHGGYMRLVNEDDSNRILELHREDGSCLLIDERPLEGGGFVTLLSDVTERKRTDFLLNSIREEQRLLARRYHEEKLKAEAASRSKTNFLAHLSHDIRTPLNHIIGFAELIRHQTFGPLGDARYLNYVETIKSSGERLLQSFATILELAELEGGQKTLREEIVKIDDIIAYSADRFKTQARQAGISVMLGAPCGAVIKADKLGLQRMLGNIIDNAIRFTPTGGRVSLAAYSASDGVVIEISDTGLGISEERLSTLSQPFVFGDAAFTRTQGGAGLGIAIARAIAELSGGKLAIDSTPALGTTVAISLPLYSGGKSGSNEIVAA